MLSLCVCVQINILFVFELSLFSALFAYEHLPTKLRLFRSASRLFAKQIEAHMI